MGVAILGTVSGRWIGSDFAFDQVDIELIGARFTSIAEAHCLSCRFRKVECNLPRLLAYLNHTATAIFTGTSPSS